PLEPKHQLDQLLLAELLQINPIHPAMDSEIAAHGKGVGNYIIDLISTFSVSLFLFAKRRALLIINIAISHLPQPRLISLACLMALRLILFEKEIARSGLPACIPIFIRA
ncbi:MAG: hypothetical protein ABSC25_23825, partial [Roseiarcus sp.]